jgi:transposase
MCLDKTKITEGKPIMLYLGLDVHSKWMTIKGFNPETGETVYEDRVSNDPISLRETFTKFNGPLSAAMESGTNSWAVYRELEEYCQDLKVVDPATVWGKEVRRTAKTNARDAMGLAQKLYRGDLVGLYVPSRKIQDQRNLARAKMHSTQMVTKIVNEIGSLLRSWGIIKECSLLSKQGKALIEKAKQGLPELSLMVLNQQLELLEKAQEVEAKLEEAVKKEAECDENCRLLMSIPGVGPFTALIVSAEIGDISRFPSFAHLISYCGLAPTVTASSDWIYYGKLSKFCNKFLKYALVLRSQGMARLREDNPFKRTYWRVVIKHHANDAKIAVARQLVRVIYSMLKRKQVWDPSKFIKPAACAAS